MAPDHPLGQAELLADPPHLVLEQRPERLDQLHPHVGGQAADVVVRLDLRRDADLAARLDHVRVERALDEEAHVAQVVRPESARADSGLAADDSFPASSSKTRMNSSPDDRALLLGLRHAGEAGEEPLAGVDVDERHVEVVAERLDDLLGLVLPQEAVVDEHARELVAHRLVDEKGRDGRVDATREAADHALGAHLRPDALDLLLDHGCGGPGRGHPGDVVEEALEDPLALGRVHDLGVELDAVEPLLGVLERRDRRRLRRGGDARPGRRGGHGVAVAHPDDLLGREIVEERPRAVQLDVRLPVLGDVVRLDGAAELAGHELHAVADAERRDAEAEDRRVGERRALGVDRGGAAGQDQRRRIARAKLVGAEPVRDELGVDARLAHPSRDQLAVLAAEVEDEHGPVLGGGLGRREGDDLSLGDSSARPS